MTTPRTSNRRRRGALLLATSLSLLSVVAPVVHADPVAIASQPTQPTKGPGADGRCASVETTFDNSAHPGNPVHAFEPSGSASASTGGRCNDRQRPTLFFAHGLNLSDPADYAVLITHLVSIGNVVVFPTYQLNSGSKDAALTAYRTVDDGYVQAASKQRRVDTSRIGFWGHSFGASMVPYLAQRSAARGWGKNAFWMTSVAMTFALGVGTGTIKVPSWTQALFVAMEEDELADARIGDEVFEAMSLPAQQKRHVVVNSDAHGQPPIIADHTSPSGGNGSGVDASDYLFMRFDDLLESCAVDHQCDGDFSNAGTWSDGTPVAASIVSPHPVDVGPYPAALAECDGVYGQMLNQDRIKRCGATHISVGL